MSAMNGPGPAEAGSGTGTAAPSPAARHQAAEPRTRSPRWVWPAAYAIAATLLFFCYLRVSGTQAVTSDGASMALQAWDMLHGNWLLKGWTLTDVSFYTTELPEYILVGVFRGPGQQDRQRRPRQGPDRGRHHDRPAGRARRVPAAAVPRPHRHRRALAADLPLARPRGTPPLGAGRRRAAAGLGADRGPDRGHDRRAACRGGVRGPCLPGGDPPPEHPTGVRVRGRARGGRGRLRRRGGCLREDHRALRRLYDSPAEHPVLARRRLADPRHAD